jgi:hypothetical protein
MSMMRCAAVATAMACAFAALCGCGSNFEACHDGACTDAGSGGGNEGDASDDATIIVIVSPKGEPDAGDADSDDGGDTEASDEATAPSCLRMRIPRTRNAS